MAESGLKFLQAALGAPAFDLRHAGEEAFTRWLQSEVQRRLEFDEVFIQKRRVRDIRRSHHDSLSQLQKNLEASDALYEECPNKTRLDEIAYQIHCNERAISGLSQALSKDPLPSLSDKLESFKSDQKELRVEESGLIAVTPEHSILLRERTALEAFEDQIGLTRELAALKSLQHQRGRSSGKSGQDFEIFARNIVIEKLTPLLSSPKETLHCLSGVTLGCARGELDFVLIVERGPEQSVEVRGIVEVKKNINDIAESFLTRQENIAWFVGEEDRYDSERYRTAVYRNGHFHKSATHKEQGRSWLFDQGSFSKFKRDSKSDHYLEGLCFLTRLRPLTGASAGEQSRLIHSVATDFNADINNTQYREELLLWAREWLGEFQTREVLEEYLKNEDLARQILFVLPDYSNE